MRFAKEFLFNFAVLMGMMAAVVGVGLISFMLPWWAGLIFVVAIFSLFVTIAFKRK